MLHVGKEWNLQMEFVADLLALSLSSWCILNTWILKKNGLLLCWGKAKRWVSTLLFHTIVIITALDRVSKPEYLLPLAFFPGLLHYSGLFVNLDFFFPRSEENVLGILIRISLNLKIALGVEGIFIILPIHEHGRIFSFFGLFYLVPNIFQLSL